MRWLRSRPIATSALIADLVGLALPGLESGVRFLGQEAGHRQAPPLYRERDLAIDEIIIEADTRRIGAAVGVIDPIEPRPIDRREAHGAGLAARIDLAAGEAEIPLGGAGSAYGADLGMRGRIIGGGNLVPPLRDDPITAHDDGAEGTAAAALHLLLRQRQRRAHLMGVAHASFPLAWCGSAGHAAIAALRSCSNC